jgi:hypothetical protein
MFYGIFYALSSTFHAGKGNTVPVTGHGGSQGCKTHFVDSQLTDNDEVVSLTLWPHFTTVEIPDTCSVKAQVDLRAVVRLEELGKLK